MTDRKFYAFYLCCCMIFISIIFSSCRDCEETMEMDMPDLEITSISFGKKKEVKTGDKISMKLVIKNHTGDSCDGTQAADESDIQFIVLFESNTSSDLDTVLITNKPVARVKASKSVKLVYSVTFSEPGQYEIVAIADGTYRINERNEVNNDYSGTGLGTNKGKFGLMVDVLENSDFDPGKSGFSAKEKVKIN